MGEIASEWILLCSRIISTENQKSRGGVPIVRTARDVECGDSSLVNKIGPRPIHQKFLLNYFQIIYVPYKNKNDRDTYGITITMNVLSTTTSSDSKLEASIHPF
jgi:hypothetical protein